MTKTVTKFKRAFKSLILLAGRPHTSSKNPLLKFWGDQKFLSRPEHGFEYLSHEHVTDGVEHKPDVGGVGGAGEVSVNFLAVPLLVLSLELLPDVVGRLLEVVFALVLREADFEGALLDLFFEEIFFVQEQYH